MSDGNGLWRFEDESFFWSAEDSIEYWLSVETSNLGYYSNQIVKVQGKKSDVFLNSER